ncbi:MAG: hypothetical protein ACK2UY_01715 [Anaerolineae bacterium]
MKRLLVVVGILAAILAVVGMPAPPATAAPVVTITLLNPPSPEGLALEVGETYTFDIEVTSDEMFQMAMAQTDAYYPGRGVTWHGQDHVTRGTYALLHLTVTGKNSTADLQAVCDWPLQGDCWPDGVAPLAIAVGARFKKGELVVEWFPFSVEVP